MPLRHLIQSRVHALIGFGSGEIDLTTGDAGMFGPHSVAWRVHGDFTSMMAGGIAALLLQMLHPGAMAGVWDHSNFRDDMLGRLKRTAQFIAGTTYGSTGQAERLIARVRAIHDHVHGHLPDGTLYSANDPALLTWVHVAEMRSFLAAYQLYCGPIAPAEQDGYYAEVALIAERLGAADVPRSRAAVEAYLQAMRPHLRTDAHTREATEALLRAPGNPAARAVMMRAGIDLLPDWAAAMHGLTLGPAGRGLTRAGTRGLGRLLHWAITDGSARRARERVAGCDAAAEAVGAA